MLAILPTDFGKISCFVYLLTSVPLGIESRLRSCKQLYNFSSNIKLDAEAIMSIS